MSPTAIDAASASPVVDTKRVKTPAPADVTVSDNEARAIEAVPTAAPRRRLSSTGNIDDALLLADIVPPASGVVRRTKSCGCERRRTGAHRVRIHYNDEELRARSERNAQELLQAAFDDASASSTTSILARKALRYRRILERMEEAQVDVHDPSFDASACLGVEWHYVASDSS